MNTFILLFECHDQQGIVAKISALIFKYGGNIITADQYSSDVTSGHFFLRIEFFLDDRRTSKETLQEKLAPIAKKFKAQCAIYQKTKRMNAGILVSEPGHCLAEILYLWKTGELAMNIPFIISNFSGHQELAKQYKIPFYFIKATKENRREDELLKIIGGKTDFLILARYMLILSKNFLSSYKKDIINVHHGFLPSFKGMNPYQQALDKGVKIIGATSHFVTEGLDEGPIIAQAVEHVSHTDNLQSLIRKGKTLEKKVLVEAVHNYIDYRIIKYRNKTIVFSL
ncbi:MAG: formyltetrahydrofolate deformylase [Candidatus Omnitrophica bacterium]|nr:formyltetrahydrofolate deformylase [Candidatus Omnitrophota bacterium]